VTDFSDEVMTRDVLRAELTTLLEQLEARAARSEPAAESEAR